MIPNVNPDTGIALGVLQGNGAPELVDDIMTQGTDETFEEQKQELRDAIKAAVRGVIEDITFQADRVIEQGLDEHSILDSLESAGLWDHYEDEEHVYSYELDYPEGTAKLELHWLGGAPLIYVCESPWVAECRHCSPCCPNAGDLDTKGSMLAYCLSPDDMPEDSPLTPRLLNAKESVPHRGECDSPTVDGPDGEALRDTSAGE